MADQEESVAALPETSEKPVKKKIPCRYCTRHFARLEHVQRHERTHTKEKPFACDCGKSFARRDLYVRHTRAAHKVDEPARSSVRATRRVNKHPRRYTETLSPVATDIPHTTNSARPPEVEIRSDVGIDIPADHLEAAVGISLLGVETETQLLPQQQEMAAQQHRPQGLPPPLHGHRQSTFEAASNVTEDFASMPHSMPLSHGMPITSSGIMSSVQFPGADEFMYEDYNMFLDDFDLSAHFLSAGDEIDPSLQLMFHPNLTGTAHGSQIPGTERHAENIESTPFSRLGSRLPSLEPGARDLQPVQSRASPPWRVTSYDHRSVCSAVDDFSHVLESSFTLPSRHALSRFLEGYISGFHEHLPFLHIPTFSAPSCAPELLLALAAVGAQYRFEPELGNSLWYASRSICQEQIKRRNRRRRPMQERTRIGRQKSMSFSPNDTSGVHESPDFSESYAPFNSAEVSVPEMARARIETIQAFLLLSAMAAWGNRSLLEDGLSIQSQVALLVREEDLINSPKATGDPDWQEAIRVEGRKRTMLIVYCLFNLQMIAYNVPPLILTSEIVSPLPLSAREWKAKSEVEWEMARKEDGNQERSLQSCYRDLFSNNPIVTSPTVSSLGHYVLIHTLMQHIFMLRQLGTAVDGNLRREDIERLVQALRRWQVGWEATPGSDLDPHNPDGPIAFNSTALLRLAYIRLYSDLGPCRQLDSREPGRVVNAFKKFPPLHRSSYLGEAILQAAHALSIPVRFGINFVAHTQTFSWSIQHSLCNLECALILSNWLQTLSNTMDQDPLTIGEKKLLSLIESMLKETDFGINDDSNQLAPLDVKRKIRQLACSVLMLWAVTFKGTHIFPVVKLIGTTLERYAIWMKASLDEQDM